MIINYIPFDFSNIELEPQSVRIQIDDKILIFSVRKPKYSDNYFLDIYDVAMDPIIKGVMLSKGIDLSLGNLDKRLPANTKFSVLSLNNTGNRSNLEFPMLGKDYVVGLVRFK